MLMSTMAGGLGRVGGPGGNTMVSMFTVPAVAVVITVRV
jgi:hypothetical protein